jgi:hypothetical protein
MRAVGGDIGLGRRLETQPPPLFTASNAHEFALVQTRTLLEACQAQTSSG